MSQDFASLGEIKRPRNKLTCGNSFNYLLAIVDSDVKNFENAIQEVCIHEKGIYDDDDDNEVSSDVCMRSNIVSPITMLDWDIDEIERPRNIPSNGKEVFAAPIEYNVIVPTLVNQCMGKYLMPVMNVPYVEESSKSLAIVDFDLEPTKRRGTEKSIVNLCTEWDMDDEIEICRGRGGPRKKMEAPGEDLNSALEAKRVENVTKINHDASYIDACGEIEICRGCAFVSVKHIQEVDEVSMGDGTEDLVQEWTLDDKRTCHRYESFRELSDEWCRTSSDEEEVSYEEDSIELLRGRPRRIKTGSSF